jgi:hypothetical protein
MQESPHTRQNPPLAQLEGALEAWLRPTASWPPLGPPFDRQNFGARDAPNASDDHHYPHWANHTSEGPMSCVGQPLQN